MRTLARWATSSARPRSSRRRFQPGNFLVAPVERMPFPVRVRDVVLSSAGPAFRQGRRPVGAMVGEMWRVLNRGGMLCAGLASTIGIADRVQPIQGRWSRLPDGQRALSRGRGTARPTSP